MWKYQLYSHGLHPESDELGTSLVCEDALLGAWVSGGSHEKSPRRDATRTKEGRRRRACAKPEAVRAIQRGDGGHRARGARKVTHTRCPVHRSKHTNKGRSLCVVDLIWKV